MVEYDRFHVGVLTVNEHLARLVYIVERAIGHPDIFHHALARTGVHMDERIACTHIVEKAVGERQVVDGDAVAALQTEEGILDVGHFAIGEREIAYRGAGTLVDKIACAILFQL